MGAGTFSVRLNQLPLPVGHRLERQAVNSGFPFAARAYGDREDRKRRYPPVNNHAGVRLDTQRGGGQEALRNQGIRRLDNAPQGQRRRSEHGA